MLHNAHSSKFYLFFRHCTVIGLIVIMCICHLTIEYLKAFIFQGAYVRASPFAPTLTYSWHQVHPTDRNQGTGKVWSSVESTIQVRTGRCQNTVIAGK